MSEPQPPDGDELKTPLGFKLMVVLVVIYLGWRLVEGIAWVIRQIG